MISFEMIASAIDNIFSLVSGVSPQADRWPPEAASLINKRN
jgi:hypothetical protein